MDHRISLDKRAYNAIRGNLWRWFKSYITKHCQKALALNQMWFQLVLGSPKGQYQARYFLSSNDIKKYFKFFKLLLHADDLKMYHSINTYQDHLKFQKDLGRFLVYFIKNNFTPKTKTNNFIQIQINFIPPYCDTFMMSL